ncbi:MAG TPA: hypothetical protein PK887_02040 [Ignavibacteriales bacterium]|nr:hypothetical protein [Ignavibacteriales bacterium]
MKHSISSALCHCFDVGNFDFLIVSNNNGNFVIIKMYFYLVDTTLGLIFQVYKRIRIL